MRRRSERKKSASPAPLPARRSRRSRKVSENEKNDDDSQPLSALIKKPEEAKELSQSEEINEEAERASSEERATESTSPSPVRKSRSSGTRTTPKKRSQREKSVDRKVETIPEEKETENGSAAEANANHSAGPITVAVDESEEKTQNKADDDVGKPAEPEEMPKQEKEDLKEEKPKQEQQQATGEQEVKIPSPTISLNATKEEEHIKNTSDVLDIQTEDVEMKDEESRPRPEQEERREKKKHKDQKQEEPPVKEKEKEASDEHKENRVDSQAVSDHTDTVASPQESAVHEGAKEKTDSLSLQTQRSARKRKWLTKKVTERAAPVLAISTDSLKNIIADVVQPVPLSDVQLDSSSEEEGLVTSDRDSGEAERSLTPELVRVISTTQMDRELAANDASPQLEKTVAPLVAANNSATTTTAAAPAPTVARSPSPARNRASHVLYITNLVRPFTVLQLKGLLARTGKIIEEDGFWIDRIKSKCYVAYTTEDEAIETRHALHGVRWPVSNPKCLNVDFGSRSDMDRAIQSTKDEAPKYAQDNTRDNQQSRDTWSRLEAGDKKPARPVREWDVGKKEPQERDKISNDRDRRRGTSKDRHGSRSRDTEQRGSGGVERASGQDRKRSRERERERGGRERGGEPTHGRSRSGSPAPKTKKKENEPPIRLLDDLFRKTKATPCIYWLPLTPEAIAEKEAFRQKRIEEHKQRVKDREQERQKEREREKERDRQRDSRRNRSNERERRRSRSRDRRRY